MGNHSHFELRKEQVDFLRQKYANVPIVQKVLAAEKDLHFEVSVDERIDFWMWLDMESVMTMDDEQEPTKDTYIIEGIIDYMHWQEVN